VGGLGAGRTSLPEPENGRAEVATAPASQSRWLTWLLVLLVVLVAAPSVMLGLRTYRTFTLLASAFEVGVPGLSSVRPWMTLRYVTTAYRAPETALRERLGLSPTMNPDTTLKALAERAGVLPRDYVRRVQRAIAEVAPAPAESRDREATGWLDGLGEEFVSALLVYGYPALALTLLLGALGLPLPSGLSMVVAGSLAAQGRMSWLLVAPLATAAAVAGDLAGYGLGRVLGGDLLERRGRWLGLTPERRARVERLFDHWGGLSVLLSRSLVSVLSSAVNLVAGASRYRLSGFVAFGIAGRLTWTSAYLGLGYVASGGLEPAADFLRTLTGFLVSLALLAGLGFAVSRSRRCRSSMV
jgi:membrane protein DedA with SNARE-associated domain